MVLFGTALRQMTGCVGSLLTLVDLNWQVPDFCMLSRRKKSLAVNVPYLDSKGSLHLLIDSAGIKVGGEGEWNARMYGGPKRVAIVARSNGAIWLTWQKIHLGIDEHTQEVRAVEITGNHIGEAPILPDLLGQIPVIEQNGSVTATALRTNTCHETTVERGANGIGYSLEPITFASSFPHCRNVKQWKPTTAGGIARNEVHRSRHLAKLDRIPPPKSGRDKDAPY